MNNPIILSSPGKGKHPITEMPPEILDQIFEEVRPDLSSGKQELLALTFARKLKGCAERALYRFISIEISDRCDTLQHVCQKLFFQPDLTKHTKYLSLISNSALSNTLIFKHKYWESLAGTLLIHCPNLEHLVLQVVPSMPKTKKALTRLLKLVDLELRSTQALQYGLDLLPPGVKHLSIDGYQAYRIPERGLPAVHGGISFHHFSGRKSRLSTITEVRLTNLQWGDDRLNEQVPFLYCLLEHSWVFQRFANLRKLSMIFSVLSIGWRPLHCAIALFSKRVSKLTELEFRGKFNDDDCAAPQELPDDLKNLQRLSIAVRTIGMDTVHPVFSLPPSVQHLDLWMYHFSPDQFCEVLYNIFQICNKPDSNFEGKPHLPFANGMLNFTLISCLLKCENLL